MLPIRAILSCLITSAVFSSSYYTTKILTSGVKTEGDPCLPPAAVDIVYDERKITAIDTEKGSHTIPLTGELVRLATSCGSGALVIGERNLHFYSSETGTWKSMHLIESDQSTSPARAVNWATGRRIIVYSTFAQAYFFNATNGHMFSISLNGERLRGAVAFDDTACVITDRQVHCLTITQPEIQSFSLTDMHIRSAKASAGKIVMTAPEKNLIYFSRTNRFELIPLR